MESSGIVVSKAAKKNKKKKQQKKAASASVSGSGAGAIGGASDGRMTAAELLPVLKQQLEDAKNTKDHELAAKLRMQLWVVTDLANGIKTDMEEEDYARILASLPLFSPTSVAHTKEVSTSGQGSGGAGSGGGSSTENRVRTLRKKLDQIAELKAKQAKGVTLELNQIEKIKNENVLRQELEELESVFRELHVAVA